MSLLLDLVFIVLAVMLVVFGAMTVFHRSLVYSAVFLAFLGLTNAAVFYILGFPLLAFIQIIIYVGSGVLFIIIAVSMLKEPKVARVNAGNEVALAVFIIAFAVALVVSIGIVPASTGYVSVQGLLQYIVSNGEISIFVLIAVLSVALIASISIAIREDQQ
ncbi:MAG: NADH-quinone oxidoreductase subunit J [Nitrososphaerota archaeon]|jgi:NADH:ubiquinone oxidoreductase subunit 6 (subunit J)|nr:NADH-quinone oxidoreductase subunit J [Nitrososphaerota archaeon]MDG6927612.1 NADH-quinone oxidoreductase subunit J [Nitrososphaerota archaeon]MDG6929935.1 NADH-quinone oxidoreductase subunit J [Nitrososphaerota archaeon]MDG6931615.1 NADH-quinone oxidoreductase subunit J [Nitrososphaerota archaeon]MDG6935968.1 NADH-quinone oxidoreductase subunit J [Nitrososphaerota archaeon]